MYLRALSISERLALDEAPSAPRMRVLSRTNLLYRTAGVAATFATIAEKQVQLDDTEFLPMSRR